MDPGEYFGILGTHVYQKLGTHVYQLLIRTLAGARALLKLPLLCPGLILPQELPAHL